MKSNTNGLKGSDGDDKYDRFDRIALGEEVIVDQYGGEKRGTVADINYVPIENWSEDDLEWFGDRVDERGSIEITVETDDGDWFCVASFEHDSDIRYPFW